MLDKEFLDILACPKCKGELTYAPADATLTCEICSFRFRVEDDVPVLLIDEAEKF